MPTQIATAAAARPQFTIGSSHDPSTQLTLPGGAAATYPAHVEAAPNESPDPADRTPAQCSRAAMALGVAWGVASGEGRVIGCVVAVGGTVGPVVAAS